MTREELERTALLLNSAKQSSEFGLETERVHPTCDTHGAKQDDHRHPLSGSPTGEPHHQACHERQTRRKTRNVSRPDDVGVENVYEHRAGAVIVGFSNEASKISVMEMPRAQGAIGDSAETEFETADAKILILVMAAIERI